MAILGIKNRTENWKTTVYFSPFMSCGSARAALAQRLGEPENTPGKDIRIELFWKGVRDYLKQNALNSRDMFDDFAQSYRDRFDDLREEISSFDGFKDLKGWNYDASTKYPTRVERAAASDKLSDNLENTEIDIILQTPDRLFIGEAKDEGSLGTESDYVLVHQLIRQYVTASILVELLHSDKIVVPFVVGRSDKIAGLRSTRQVAFMLSKKWLKSQNVLSWDELATLAKPAGSPVRPAKSRPEA